MIKSKLLLILVFLCVIAYGVTSTRRFNDADETRYVEIPREMMETGNCYIPTLNYVPYFEKPVFSYWLTVLSFKLFGISPLSARLWVIIFSILGVILTYYFSFLIKKSHESAFISALILSTSLGYAVLSTILITDMIFSVFLFSSFFSFWVVYKDEASSEKWKIVFWIALSLAFLTKGPLALVILLGSLCLFSVFNKKMDWLGRIGIKRGFLIFLIINLPWHIAVFLKNPRLLEFFYIRQNFMAFFDGNVHHTQSSFYYLICLFFGLFPWFSVFCGTAFSVTQKIFLKRETVGEEQRFFWAGSLFVFVFFNMASSKLAAYILPAFPFLSILMSHYIEENKNSKFLRYGFLIQSLIITGIMSVMFVTKGAHVLPSDKTVFFGVILAIILIFGAMLFSSYKALRGFIKQAVVIQSALMLVLVPIGMHFYSYITPHKTLETILKTIPPENFRKDDKIISVYSNAYSLLIFFKKPMYLLERALELGFGYYILENPEGKEASKDYYQISGENFKSENLLDYPLLPQIWNQDQRIWLFTHARKKSKIDQIDKLNLKYYKVASDKDNLLITNKPLISDMNS